MKRILPTLLVPLAIASPAAANTTDVTFIFTSDTHYGLDQWADNEALNKQGIDRMNAIPGTPYPSSVGGGVVDTPRGVLVSGDLTDTGEDTNWYGYWFFGHIDGFVDDYALGGAGRIDYEVYEGFGNHDIHSPATGVVLGGIKDRNASRLGLTGLSTNELHYSWDWDDVHFVNLNVYPGGAGDAHDSLQFLEQDLAAQVGSSQRPVILYHHYGFDPFGLGWWTIDERQAYHDVIKDYNVVAIFNGHNHATQYRTWKGIDVFNTAIPKDQKFLVVHITNDQLVVAERVADSWGNVWTKELSDPDPVSYCTSSPNSAGPGAVIGWSGTPSLTAGDFVLACTELPPDQFLMFYYGGGQTSVPFGNGIRCVNSGGAGIYRFKPFTADFLGAAIMPVDFDQPPAGSGAGEWTPGSIWNVQAWYRDPAAGGAQFNLSDGLMVTVWP